MKSQADKHRTDFTFQVGDLVLLRLQPYRQLSVHRRSSQKLALRFYGPFSVLERIGQVAYRLDLPPSSRVHPVFHVSLLRPFHSSVAYNLHPLPDSVADSSVTHVPCAVIAERQIWRAGRATPQVLVQWSGLLPEDSTWEDKHAVAAEHDHLFPLPELSRPHTTVLPPSLNEHPPASSLSPVFPLPSPLEPSPSPCPLSPHPPSSEHPTLSLPPPHHPSQSPPSVLSSPPAPSHSSKPLPQYPLNAPSLSPNSRDQVIEPTPLSTDTSLSKVVEIPTPSRAPANYAPLGTPIASPSTATISSSLTIPSPPFDPTQPSSVFSPTQLITLPRAPASGFSPGLEDEAHFEGADGVMSAGPDMELGLEPKRKRNLPKQFKDFVMG